MKVTEAAVAQIRDILARADQSAAGVRVGIEKGGCAGMSYRMDIANEIGKGDEVIETSGGRVLIDPKAVLYLLGSEMDFVADKMSAKFVFRNPNEVSSCGCGESVSLEPAKLA
jgi:iron-sulfur cluster assembly protein